MCGPHPPAKRSSVPRRLASEEGGQILLMTGVLMGIMIVLVALVVDIGHTRLVQRQLQAGVDAAALAAAQELPDETVAVATANEYSPTPGKKNAVNTVGNATTTAIARCITVDPGLQHALRRRERGDGDVHLEGPDLLRAHHRRQLADRHRAGDGVLPVLRYGRSTSCSSSTAPARCATRRTQAASASTSRRRAAASPRSSR